MSKSTRKARSRPQTPVVLDSIGLLRCRRGHATLRLKIVGPIAQLRGFKVQEGDRLRVFNHTVAAA